MTEKTDLRVIKTKKIIENGFLACLKKKTFSKLTIQDLTQEMLINKSTFYYYYSDKYNLREKVIEKKLLEFSESIDLSFVTGKTSDLLNYEKVLPHALMPVFNMREELLLLWSSNLELDVFSKMEIIFSNQYKKVLIENNPKLKEPYNELQARLFAASAMQVIKWWLEYSPHTPVDEISKIIAKCIHSGMYPAFTDFTND